ncbi:fatty acyl-AMP ligase [Streptomyces sp. NPDC058092]|uniref:fatty acyl-AMP ligase n=1 Tax=Streptomyces sp. NPDC058092 TaxID=3346336 RepID=UPI0036F0600F
MSNSRAQVAGTFAQALRERAEQSPGSTAFRFIADDGSVEEITYAELDTRARAVATGLIETAATRTTPALLLFAPGLDYLAGLFGCFYAGVPAVPAFPPDPTRLARTLPRLAAIIEDAGSDIVLTTTDIRPLIEDWLKETLGRAPRVIATDLLKDEGGGLLPPIRQDSPALLQYTSGSTSLPRGVVLTHAQLMGNCREIARGFGMHSDSSGGLWLPPYHDMGLIGGILTPLFAGIPATLMSPVSFLRRPLSWLRMVSRYRSTITGGPNFAYELCLRRATDEEVEELDLSSIELTFTGAEPVRAETMRRFAERFGPCGFRAKSFYPCYGLAEATLFVTGGTPLDGWRSMPVASAPFESDGIARQAGPAEPSRMLVSSGRPGPDTRVLIVDPSTHEPLGSGRVGEIWVDSPSVASGYWQRTEESAATFGARTAAGDGSYLRTGDLGFSLDDELFVAGRIKDLIVINGRNYHPVDIEQSCENSVPGIRRNCGAAFSVEDEHLATERLVLVYEIDPGAERPYQEVIDGIRRAVSINFSVPPYAVVLIPPRAIHKTSSGKVQRWMVRRGFLAGEFEELARWEAPVHGQSRTPQAT